MSKKLLLSLAFLLSIVSIISQVSAWEYVYTIPNGMTLEQYENSVMQANDYRHFLLIGGPSGYTTATCDYYGTFYPKDCEKNCGTGYTTSNCIYSPDSVSSMECSGKSLSSCYTIAQNVYGSRFVNKQCLCTKQSSSGCSGGYSTGDKKCSGDDVYKCSSSGSFDYVSTCEFGCNGGQCQSDPCPSHSEKKCVGNSVYWFDACGSQEEEYIQCGTNEQCTGEACVKTCEEQNVGELFCDGNAVKQQYQKQDCSTEDHIITQCTSSQKCQDGACIEVTCPVCPGSEDWSKCTEGKITRNAYVCDYSTNFECQLQAQEQSCNCDDNSGCNEDEICDTHVCKPLECKEGQTLQLHECISPFPTYLVWIGLVAVFGVTAIIFIVRKSKR